MAARGRMQARLRGWLKDGPLSERLGTAGLILAALCLVLPWYAIARDVNGTHDPLYEYTLTQKVDHEASGVTRIFPMETSACLCGEVARLFALVQLLMWTGAAIAAGAFWARQGASRPPAAAATALTAVAGLLLVAGPVLLALSAPPAYLADGDRVGGVVPTGHWGSGFMGSYPERVDQTSSWGPALGWFAALLGGALTLCAVTGKRRPVPSEANPQTVVARTAAPHPTAPPAAPMPSEAAARENAFLPPSG